MQLAIDVDDSTARAALDEARRRGPAAMEAAMFLRAQAFLDLASPLVPRLKGTLWASRYATRTSPVEAGFSAPYAALVEEKHEHHTNGQWKYASTALAQMVNQGSAQLERDFALAFDSRMTLASAPARHPERPSPGAARSMRVQPTGRR